MFTIIRKNELTHSVPISRGEANLLAERVQEGYLLCSTSGDASDEPMQTA